MKRTSTPRAAAALIASPTTAAVSAWRLKSYCARSSERFAQTMKSAMACAMSSGFCPPSVRVRTVTMDAIVDVLAEARIGNTFNFYRDGGRAGLLRGRLRAYLATRSDAPILLVGEAPGYRGARV